MGPPQKAPPPSLQLARLPLVWTLLEVQSTWSVQYGPPHRNGLDMRPENQYLEENLPLSKCLGQRKRQETLFHLFWFMPFALNQKGIQSRECSFHGDTNLESCSLISYKEKIRHPLLSVSPVLRMQASVHPVSPWARHLTLICQKGTRWILLPGNRHMTFTILKDSWGRMEVVRAKWTIHHTAPFNCQSNCCNIPSSI